MASHASLLSSLIRLLGGQSGEDARFSLKVRAWSQGQRYRRSRGDGLPQTGLCVSLSLPPPFEKPLSQIMAELHGETISHDPPVGHVAVAMEAAISDASSSSSAATIDSMILKHGTGEAEESHALPQEADRGGSQPTPGPSSTPDPPRSSSTERSSAEHHSSPSDEPTQQHLSEQKPRSGTPPAAATPTVMTAPPSAITRHHRPPEQQPAPQPMFGGGGAS